MPRKIAGAGEVAPPRRRLSPNRIFLPTALREAIPDLPTCLGRDLELDSMTAGISKTPWFGDRVELKLLAKETGKLTGEFTLNIGLSIDAARALAELLIKVVEPTPAPTQSRN
jgi:hypothetical protein